MKHTYIILLGKRSDGYDENLDGLLRAMGMMCKLASASVRLFASIDAPIVHLQEHALIVGRIFADDGQQITFASSINGPADEFHRHLLENSWGEYLAVHLDGEKMSLLRDPSGAVPCLYSIQDGRGFITSDISLAVELGIYRREVDWQTIAHSLEFPYLKTERTALKNVSELLPGVELRIRSKKVSAHTAWSPWHFVEQRTRHSDPSEAAKDVKTAVNMAVRALAASQRRFIVELSGGLDSSIVSACLSEISQQATFCTLVMTVAGTDERPYARMVTDMLEKPLSSVEIGFDEIHFEYQVPLSSTLPAIGILQHTVNEAWEAAGTRYGVDSFFSGGGGDSIFCYLNTAAPAADAFLERGIGAGITALQDLSSLHQCTIWKATKLTYRKIRQRRPTSWKRDTALLNQAALSGVPCHHPWMDAPIGSLPGDREKIRQLISTQLFRPATPRGAGRAIHFPLLSQPVMEACLRVPTWMWISKGRNRAIARDAFANHLPAGILNRRSKGSYTGVLAGVYTHHRQAMHRFLAEGTLHSNGLLDRAALAQIFGREQAPRETTFIRILDLCAAENWVRHQIR
jgi:asparagine synthase (glutamine-hydrolysing)